MSLAHPGGDRFRLVYAPGEVLEKADLRRCDMPISSSGRKAACAPA